MSGRYVALILAGVLVCGAAPDEKLAKLKAGKLLSEGNTFFAAGKYREALEKYQSAYAAYPSPKIFFNYAESYYGLEEWASASEYYQRFLDEAHPDPSSELAQRAAARVKSLRPPAPVVTTSSVSSAPKLEVVQEKPAPVPVVHVEPAPPPPAPPITSEWWFWTAIGAAVAVGVTAVVIASSGGDSFVPGGELGVSSLDNGWSRR